MFPLYDPWADNIIVAQIIIADHTYIVRYSTTGFADGIDAPVAKRSLNANRAVGISPV